MNFHPPPPPPLTFAPPPPPGLPVFVPGIRETSFIAESASVNELIKKQFEDCGESNEFHRSARAGDLRRLDALAARDPKIVNSKGNFC